MRVVTQVFENVYIVVILLMCFCQCSYLFRNLNYLFLPSSSSLPPRDICMPPPPPPPPPFSHSLYVSVHESPFLSFLLPLSRFFDILSFFLYPFLCLHCVYMSVSRLAPIFYWLYLRRMLRISWAEKKTNVNVLREGNVQRSLLKTIRKRQMEFLGHVCGRRGLEFLSLTGKVEGKRDRGKQRITFLDSLCNSATGGQK